LCKSRAIMLFLSRNGIKDLVKNKEVKVEMKNEAIKIVHILSRK